MALGLPDGVAVVKVENGISEGHVVVLSMLDKVLLSLLTETAEIVDDSVLGSRFIDEELAEAVVLDVLPTFVCIAADEEVFMFMDGPDDPSIETAEKVKDPISVSTLIVDELTEAEVLDVLPLVSAAADGEVSILDDDAVLCEVVASSKSPVRSLKSLKFMLLSVDTGIWKPTIAWLLSAFTKSRFVELHQ